MKKLKLLFVLWPFIVLADPPQSVTVDFDGGKAPALQVYQANQKTFLWSVKNGINAVNLTGYSPLMYWTTSNTALTVVTASCSVVTATAGTFTATFVPAQLNYAASNWIYGVGLSSGSVTVARQGTFTILADAYAMGGMTNAVSWVTNLNCDLINFINPPWNNITNSSYTKAETDAKYSTGTPLYVESDPLWNASSGGVWTAINGKQASGTYATNTAINAITATDIANWNAAGTAVDTNALISRITATEGYTNRAALALASNVYDSFVAAMLATNNAQSALITLLQGYTNTAAAALASNVYDSFVAAMLATNNAQTALILAETASRIAHDGTNAANILAVGAGATNESRAVGLGATNLVAVETAARIAHDSTNAANILAVGAGASNLVNASGAGSTNYANAVGNAVGAGATNLYTVEAAARAAHDSTNAANILAVGAGATNIAKATGAGATNIALAVGAGATNLFTVEAAARLAWDTTNAAAAASANTNANGRTPIGTHAASTAALWSAIETITTSNTSISAGTNIYVESSGGGSAYTINLRINTDVPIGAHDSSSSKAIIWYANGSGIHTTRWGSAGFIIDGNTAFHSGNLNTNSFAPIASWAAFTAAYSTASAAQTSTNAGFQSALDGKMSITGLVPVLTVANLASVGTNLTALTASYTGALGGVIVYTGAVNWVAGKTYSVGMGLSATYLGTSWLSIAEHRLTNSAVGTSVSNYFTATSATGTMTLSIASVAGMAQIITNVFVREVTTGNLAVAGTLDVGQDARFGGTIDLGGVGEIKGLKSTASIGNQSTTNFVLKQGDSEDAKIKVAEISLFGEVWSSSNIMRIWWSGPDTWQDVTFDTTDGSLKINGLPFYCLTNQTFYGNAVNFTNFPSTLALNADLQTVGAVASNAMPKSGGTFTGGVTNNVGIFGNALGLTNLNAANLAVGGTLPALDGSSVTGIVAAVTLTNAPFAAGKLVIATTDGGTSLYAAAESSAPYDHSHATNSIALTFVQIPNATTTQVTRASGIGMQIAFTNALTGINLFTDTGVSSAFFIDYTGTNSVNLTVTNTGVVRGWSSIVLTNSGWGQLILRKPQGSETWRIDQ